MALLYDMVEVLMEDCGFPEDLYIISERDDMVIIEVDHKEAATYILKIAEEDQYKDIMFGNCERNGKRHKITFFLW
jgi:hypothetical protein